MKIVSKGQKFDVDEKLFDKGGVNIVYGANGQGKSSFGAVFSQLDEDSRKKDIDDKFGVISADLSECVTYIKTNNRTIHYISEETNDNLDFSNSRKIIMNEHAKRISELSDEIRIFKEKANTQTSKLKSGLLNIFNKNTVANINKKFGITNTYFPFQLFDNISSEQKSEDSDIRLFIEQFYNTKNDLIFKDVLESLIGLKNELKDYVINDKNKINENNKGFFEHLLDGYKYHSKFVDGTLCPICDTEVDLNEKFESIRKQIELFNKTNANNLFNLKKQFDALNIDSALYKWVSIEEVDIEEIQKLIARLDLYKTNADEYILHVIYKLISDEIKKNKELEKLNDELPEIKPEFLSRFKEYIGNIATFDPHEYDIKLSADKKSIYIEMNKDSKVDFKNVSSSSMLNMLALGYKMHMSITKKDPIILFDDPTDSNDLLNIMNVKELIDSFWHSDTTIIVLTHDSDLLEVFSADDDVNRDQYNLYILEEITPQEKQISLVCKMYESYATEVKYAEMLQELNGSWERFLILVMLMRVTAKMQVLYVKDRSEAEAKSTKKVIYNGISKLMHFNEFDNNSYVDNYLGEAEAEFDVNVARGNISINSIQLIDELITYASVNKFVGTKHFTHLSIIIHNMLQAIRIRILFEQKIYLIDANGFTAKTSAPFKKFKPSMKFDVVKHSKIKPFWNKYKGIVNNLAHSLENNKYIYYGINKYLLKMADLDLKKY